MKRLTMFVVFALLLSACGTNSTTISPISNRPSSTNNTSATGTWSIQYFTGATAQMRGWTFKNPEPKTWPKFPNVDNGQYLAKDGVEYGMAESLYCQRGQTCDFNIPAMHYRLYTGDYALPFDQCQASADQGCAVIMVNVGTVTAVFRDQTGDLGFTLEGRYWNGDMLPQAIWAIASHTLYNMLNLEGKTNAGANCSVPTGCQSVRMTFVITSGNEVLVKGTTSVSR